MPPPDPWPTAALERLGKVPDSAIAADLGISRQAVAAKRTTLGIPAAGAKPGPKPRGEEAEGLRIRLTTEERAEIERAAGDEELSSWARRKLLEAARRTRR
jgi:hypothetical protein